MTYSSCILELRARIEDLEATVKHYRIDHLRLANATANLAEDRVKFFVDTMSDHDVDIEQHASAAIINQTSNLNQTKGYLLERVRDAVASEYDPKDFCWQEASHAIREVAEWIRHNHPGFQEISTILENEAKAND